MKETSEYNFILSLFLLGLSFILAAIEFQTLLAGLVNSQHWQIISMKKESKSEQNLLVQWTDKEIVLANEMTLEKSVKIN